jgi:hypothetical protein
MAFPKSLKQSKAMQSLHSGVISGEKDFAEDMHPSFSSTSIHSHDKLIEYLKNHP